MIVVSVRSADVHLRDVMGVNIRHICVCGQNTCCIRPDWFPDDTFGANYNISPKGKLGISTSSNSSYATASFKH